MVRQLRQERGSQSPKATPMTPEQLKFRELEKYIGQVILATTHYSIHTYSIINVCFWHKPAIKPAPATWELNTLIPARLYNVTMQ